METERLDEVRRAALNRVDRTERAFKWLSVGAFLTEGFFLLGVLLLVDYSDRLHLLVLMCSFLVYMTLGMGIVALAAYVKLNALRVMKCVAATPSRATPSGVAPATSPGENPPTPAPPA